jgi:acyl-CoA synthetase (AMP-forming)/AMP-acid ligase II
VPGSNIRICDPETGYVLSRGETGELQMSGPSVIEGYLADGDKIFQNEAFCTDGSRTWFKSGDAALMREGGEVFISGRYKDMIIRGGENMSPGYIENSVDGIEGVKVRNHL